MLEKFSNLFTSICSLNLLQILAIYGFVFLILFSIYLAIVSIYSFKITWNDILASHGVERFAFFFLAFLPMLFALICIIFIFSLCFDSFIDHGSRSFYAMSVMGFVMLLYKGHFLVKYHEPLSIIMEIAQTVLNITELKLLTQEDIKSATTETVVSLVQFIDELNEEKKDSIAKEMDLEKEETEVAK